MRILHLSINVYSFWSTYEAEYLNEALMEDPKVELRIWGRFRPFYQADLNAVEIVETLYGNSYPDVIIVHSTMARSKDKSDRRILEGLEELRKRCTIVWRTSDPWRVDFYKAQYEQYKPHIWLVWYPDYVELFRNMFDPAVSSVFFFPHAVGRRFLSKWTERPYDLALIGRCEHEGRPLTKQDFAGLNVLQPPRFKKRPDAFGELIRNLNISKASWNSPFHGKYATLRFVEAPACGTLSITPHHFRDLNEYYFPRDAYLTCDDDPEKAVDIIRSLNADKELYFALQERAYEIVMNNHQMRNRVMYLRDILNGKPNADPRDYYGISI